MYIKLRALKMLYTIGPKPVETVAFCTDKIVLEDIEIISTISGDILHWTHFSTEATDITSGASPGDDAYHAPCAPSREEFDQLCTHIT
jgi:hypothetical protein